jgi:hypothetical protein
VSLAEEPQVLGVAAEIADAFADEDGRKLELLDWLDEHGFGSTPQNQIPAAVYAQARRELGHAAPAAPPPLKTFAPPPPHPDPEERAQPPSGGSPTARNIPRNIPAHVAPAEPAARTETVSMRTCKQCGKTGHDRRTCPELKKTPAAAPAKNGAAPKAEALGAPRDARLVNFQAMTVDELVSLRAAVFAELLARKKRTEADLKRITEVVG